MATFLDTQLQVLINKSKCVLILTVILGMSFVLPVQVEQTSLNIFLRLDVLTISLRFVLFMMIQRVKLGSTNQIVKYLTRQSLQQP